MSVKEVDGLLSLLVDKKRRMEQEQAESNIKIMLSFLHSLRKQKLDELTEVLEFMSTFGSFLNREYSALIEDSYNFHCVVTIRSPVHKGGHKRRREAQNRTIPGQRKILGENENGCG